MPTRDFNLPVTPAHGITALRTGLPLVLVLWLGGCLLPASRAEDATPTRYGTLGTLLLTNLASAPFPHPARAEGHRYKEKLYPAAQHYQDNSVAIFVPRGFRASPDVDLVLHFHGWFNNVTNVLSQFQLPEQFAASRRNAILVVPQGPRDAPDSFGGKLEDAGSFARFLAELHDVLKGVPGCGQAPLGRVILSGHSGGYRVIARCLAQNGATNTVREVWLFDALYAEADKYEAWWQATHGRLLNIHTKDGGTRAETEKFLARMKALGAPLLAGTDESLSPTQLREARLIFISTDLGHNEVVAKRKSFQRFLETSCLGSLSGPGGQTSANAP
jgi:hypothetical protein